MSNEDKQSTFQNGTMPHLAGLLLASDPIHIGEWQSKDTSRVPQMATYEVIDLTFDIDTVPTTAVEWAVMLGDDLNTAWAEEHFMERVGGVPVNPPPSHQRWPWAKYNGNHQTGEQHIFSHTYPERMWPMRKDPSFAEGRTYSPIYGVRYQYGDLNDLLDLLIRSPLTRQAYLPIWFPEDTGAHHRQRVPCTLGYHFMIRDGQLSCRYYMRSCDLIRHFTDDVYLSGRLMQWITDRITACPNPWHESAPSRAQNKADCPECPAKVTPGKLVMYISSLHAFVGDEYKLKQIAGRPNALADR